MTNDDRSERSIISLSHSDVAGRPDGAQVMVGAGFAYYGHMTSGGYSILNVRDPREPTVVGYVPGVGTSWNGHLQLHEKLHQIVSRRTGKWKTHCHIKLIPYGCYTVQNRRQ